MKKILRLLLPVMLVLALLAACGAAKPDSAGNTGNQTAQEVENGNANDDLSLVDEGDDGDELSLVEDGNGQDGQDDYGITVTEDGEYTSKDEVALYIYTYGHLPSNYISKSKAKKLGWVSSEGNLDEVAPGKSIGGSYFGNYEGLLPDNEEYRECDIDYEGGRRNAKRIIYTVDGEHVYYTEDHYKTFEQLY